MTDLNASRQDDLLDEGLRAILGSRYEDTSDKFTPEAQKRRRNNRLMFTVRISAFVLVLCNFVVWAFGEGLMPAGIAVLGFSLGMVIIGYNIGVCVSHNKGWRD